MEREMLSLGNLKLPHFLYKMEMNGIVSAVIFWWGNAKWTLFKAPFCLQTLEMIKTLTIISLMFVKQVAWLKLFQGVEDLLKITPVFLTTVIKLQFFFTGINHISLSRRQMQHTAR